MFYFGACSISAGVAEKGRKAEPGGCAECGRGNDRCGAVQWTVADAQQEKPELNPPSRGRDSSIAAIMANSEIEEHRQNCRPQRSVVARAVPPLGAMRAGERAKQAVVAWFRRHFGSLRKAAHHFGVDHQTAR